MRVVDGLAPGCITLGRRIADLSHEARTRLKWFDLRGGGAERPEDLSALRDIAGHLLPLEEAVQAPRSDDPGRSGASAEACAAAHLDAGDGAGGAGVAGRVPTVGKGQAVTSPG